MTAEKKTSKFQAKPTRERLTNSLLFGSSIVFTFILLEIIARFAFPFAVAQSGYFIWPTNLTRIFRPQADVMIGIEGESTFQTNSIGLRGDELLPTHNHRILTIGGSTTECLFLDQTEAWPQLLQANMNASNSDPTNWVGNGGMSGRTTRNHLTAIQYLSIDELKIDTVIMLVGINDFARRLAQDDTYDPNFMQAEGATEQLLAHTFTGTDFERLSDSQVKRSAIWWALQVFINPPQNEPNVQDGAGRVYSKWRNHRQQADKLLTELPPMDAALTEFEQNLTDIANITSEKSVRLVLMTQPTMWQENLPSELERLLWFGGIGDFMNTPNQSYYSVEALEEGITKYNEVTLKLCSENEHIECIDLASKLPKDTSVFYDDVHFNEQGAELVANIVFEFLNP